MQLERMESFQIGDWQVEPGLNLISREGRAVSLRPRVIDLLVYMSKRAGEVISVDDIIKDVWDGVFVTNGAIYNCINELRDAFGDCKDAPKYIETISKRGYRLIAPTVGISAGHALHAHEDRRLATNRLGSPILVFGALVAGVLTAIFFQFLVPSSGQQAPASPPGTQAIAVMPFSDLSPGGDQTYFADRIAEELINSLTALPELTVIARTSSFYYRQSGKDAREIGEELGVAYILEGSVRKSGNRIRITAKLVDTKTGLHLLSKTYERELEDIFAVQDDISFAIIEALRDRLNLATAKSPHIMRAANPEAYTEYLLGRHLMNQRTPKAFKEANRHFKRAIEIDESFAPPYANMAITYGLQYGYGVISQKKAYELARPLADTAMQLDPELAEAHAAAFYMESLQNKPDPEFRHLNKAILLNPSYMDARNWKGGELLRWHRVEEANALLESSLKIDPLSTILNINTAKYLLEIGQRDEARAVAERLKSIDFAWGQRVTGDIAYDEGDLPGAIKTYLSALKSAPRHGPLIFQLAAVISELGLDAEAVRLFPEVRGGSFGSRNTGEWDLALQAANDGLESGRNLHYFVPTLAEALYFTRDFEGAVAHYDRALSAYGVPRYLSLPGEEQGYVFYAAALRYIGNEQKAEDVFEEALSIVKSRERAGYVNGELNQLAGLTLLYQGQTGEALDAFERAFEAGNRHDWEFAAPLFEPLRENPRFLALQGKYDSARRTNRAEMLVLICSGNLPDIGWRPLPEICEGFGPAGGN